MADMSAFHRQPENVALAALLVLASGFLFAAMGAVVKALAADLPNSGIVFWRNFFALMVVLPFVLRRGVGYLHTHQPMLHLLRAVAGLGAMSCFFFAIGHMPFAEAVLLKLTAPLFIPLFAFLWMGEPLPVGVALAILLGFAGVTLILAPGLGTISTVALVGLAGGALAGLAQTTVRRMARDESGLRIVFYFSAIATVVSALPAANNWVAPPAPLWGMLMLLGALGVGGQLALTRAFALALAARVGALGYSSVLFSSAMGWLFWSEVLDSSAWLGAALIVAAGILAGRAAGQAGTPAVYTPAGEPLAVDARRS